jgi:hypothetical protein
MKNLSFKKKLILFSIIDDVNSLFIVLIFLATKSVFYTIAYTVFSIFVSKFLTNYLFKEKK